MGPFRGIVERPVGSVIPPVTARMLASLIDKDLSGLHAGVVVILINLTLHTREPLPLLGEDMLINASLYLITRGVLAYGIGICTE